MSDGQYAEFCQAVDTEDLKTLLEDYLRGLCVFNVLIDEEDVDVIVRMCRRRIKIIVRTLLEKGKAIKDVEAAIKFDEPARRQ